MYALSHCKLARLKKQMSFHRSMLTRQYKDSRSRRDLCEIIKILLMHMTRISIEQFIKWSWIRLERTFFDSCVFVTWVVLCQNFCYDRYENTNSKRSIRIFENHVCPLYNLTSQQKVWYFFSKNICSSRDFL